ncbi:MULTISPECIES: hypothetical protein [unclassified Ensifer]|uniref:hypothetical protein n=1 Tax=unclassified Ensifer TaxID=2633371 RepID=UPI001FD9412C|nr:MULTISPECIES: hypothetical protein [Ensifer]
MAAVDFFKSGLWPCLCEFDRLILRFNRRRIFDWRRFGHSKLGWRKFKHRLDLLKLFCGRSYSFNWIVVRLNICRARRIIGIELSKELFLEIERRILPDGFLVALQFLQLLDSRPGIVADDPGEFGQRIIVCQYIEFSRPASCELFVCHALHSQLPAFTCQCIVGKW